MDDAELEKWRVRRRPRSIDVAEGVVLVKIKNLFKPTKNILLSLPGNSIFIHYILQKICWPSLFGMWHCNPIQFLTMEVIGTSVRSRGRVLDADRP